MRLATWNLNNRVGKVRFRPEAAQAAVAIGADVIVLTEYFPQHHHQQFCHVLAEGGWIHQLLPPQPTEIANRTLIASRLLLHREDLALPDFDCQFPANIVVARIGTLGLRILGIRIPAYGQGHPLLMRSWEWLEAASAALREAPAVIIGDLNIHPMPDRKGVGACFRRILDNGWQRAVPAEGYSYFGHSGVRSEIDHALVSPRCRIQGAEYVISVPGFELAGTADALSDHAALVVDVDTSLGGSER
jgi:endonuclease/exonuclease/phosphatase family metal-dependent hydrolase